MQVMFLSRDGEPIVGSAYWGENRQRDLRAVGPGGEVTIVLTNPGFLPIYLKGS